MTWIRSLHRLPDHPLDGLLAQEVKLPAAVCKAKPPFALPIETEKATHGRTQSDYGVRFTIRLNGEPYLGTWEWRGWRCRMRIGW